MIFIERAAQIWAFDDFFALAAGLTMIGVIPALMLSSKPSGRKK